MSKVINNFDTYKKEFSKDTDFTIQDSYFPILEYNKYLQ